MKIKRKLLWKDRHETTLLITYLKCNFFLNALFAAYKLLPRLNNIMAFVARFKFNYASRKLATPFNNHEAFTHWKRELGHENPLSHIPAIKGKLLSIGKWDGARKDCRCEWEMNKIVRTTYLLSWPGSLVTRYRSRNVARRLAGRERTLGSVGSTTRTAIASARRGWCIYDVQARLHRPPIRLVPHFPALCCTNFILPNLHLSYKLVTKN